MTLPKHILIIPDGNRRWAKKNGQYFFEGHRAGARAIERVLQVAIKLKIPYVTVFGLSLTNVTRRPKIEVTALFQLFEEFFRQLAKSRQIHEDRVRVNVIGRWRTFFPPSTKKQVELALKKTKKYKDRRLTLLVGYSGVDEMVGAVKKIVSRSLANPRLKMTPALIKRHLWTKDLPPVDLVIRTGGDPHWSVGCMMWDIAEAQFAFSDVFWPDFTPERFKRVLEHYGDTERRLGK